MFTNREDAGRRLARRLKGGRCTTPWYWRSLAAGSSLGPPWRGGLGADLDVVLSRKLCAPLQPELALGAVGEDGEVYLTRGAGEVHGLSRAPGGRVALSARGDRPAEEAVPRREARAPVARRSVIVTDDGIATDRPCSRPCTRLAAQGAAEVIVAVPVASPGRLAVRRCCDDVVCLLAPADFRAIGQFYEDFTQVEDAEVVALLRQLAPRRASRHLPRGNKR